MPACQLLASGGLIGAGCGAGVCHGHGVQEEMGVHAEECSLRQCVAAIRQATMKERGLNRDTCKHALVVWSVCF